MSVSSNEDTSISALQQSVHDCVRSITPVEELSEICSELDSGSWAQYHAVGYQDIHILDAEAVRCGLTTASYQSSSQTAANDVVVPSPLTFTYTEKQVLYKFASMLPRLEYITCIIETEVHE